MNRSTQQVQCRKSFFFRIIVSLGLLIVFVFSNFSLARSQSNQPSDAFSPASCTDFRLPSAWASNPRVHCGYLAVPEDHSTPDGNQIQLGVVILKSKTSGMSTSPLFIAQGGPGGSTIDTYSKLMSVETALADQRDIVLWDQRGTLFSTPNLRCQEFLDETIRTLDQILSDEESQQISLQAAQDCRDRLTRQGIDLSAYNSLQNAADIDSLRHALGYEKINFYGVSYGTLLGLHFAKLYPDSLQSLILDAVVPPQTNFLLNAGQSMTRSFNELFQACAADADCSRYYPDLEQVFYGVLQQLDANPASVLVLDSETGKVYEALIDGDLFLSTIFQLLYPTELISFLPKIIFDASQGNFDFLSNAILPLILFDQTISDGMYFSVICAEDADYTSADISTSDLPKPIAAAENRDLATFLKLCKLWNVAPLDSTIDDPVSSPVPTLLLSGGFDPITPPKFAAQVGDTLPNSYSVFFPAGGHGQAFGGSCQDQIMQAFLENPHQAPDTSCIQTELSFVTSNKIIKFPLLAALFGQDYGALVLNLFWAGAIFLIILFQLCALPVFLILFLVDRRRNKLGTSEQQPGFSNTDPKPENRWSRFSPVWPVLYAFIAIFILIGLAVLVFALFASNNPIVFFGLPSNSRPIFLIGFLLPIIFVLMLISCIVLWTRRSKSVGFRIYYLLLTLAGALGVFAFAQLHLFSLF